MFLLVRVVAAPIIILGLAVLCLGLLIGWSVIGPYKLLRRLYDRISLSKLRIGYKD